MHLVKIIVLRDYQEQENFLTLIKTWFGLIVVSLVEYYLKENEEKVELKTNLGV